MGKGQSNSIVLFFKNFCESHLEEAALEWLEELGSEEYPGKGCR